MRLAELGAEAGCDGLMVLPPYVYQGDWRETRAHFEAVIGATDLPCMLYNNPVAYGTDVVPEQVRDLADALPEESVRLFELALIRDALARRPTAQSA